MKLLKRLTFVLLLAVVFTGCNKDDDNNSAPTLIGTWKLTAEKVNGISEQLDVCELKTTLKFTDIKVTRTEYDGEDCSDVYTETYSYTRDGNWLKVIADGETMKIEITKLTSTILEFTEVDDYDNSIYVETWTRQ